jgi:hypothetical protein
MALAQPRTVEQAMALAATKDDAARDGPGRNQGMALATTKECEARAGYLFVPFWSEYKVIILVELYLHVIFYITNLFQNSIYM